MAKYRKKPVLIDAVNWTGLNQTEVFQFLGGTGSEKSYDESLNFYLNPNRVEGGLIIKTLEGEHIASIGDYIIKGVKGEFYPCKPDVFIETYDEDTHLKNYIHHTETGLPIKDLHREYSSFEPGIVKQGVIKELINEHVTWEQIKHSVTGDPYYVNQWHKQIDESEKSERKWINHLRENGIKAAHPDDGWIDRVNNRAHLCYPDFNDGLSVGDLLALGLYFDGEKCRVVRITKIEPGYITYYYFSEVKNFKWESTTNKIEHHIKETKFIKIIKALYGKRNKIQR